jgi:ATP-dependent DNA ligase
MSLAWVAGARDGNGYPPTMPIDVIPQLVASAGLKPLHAAIAEPLRYAIEPKVDGVRGLVVYSPDGRIETRNRRGEVREWLRNQPLARELRRLGQRLPILHDGTVLDGELVANRFAGTMAALHGSKRHGEALRFVVFDLPYLAGADLRGMPWRERRARLELLARAFGPPVELSPLVDPCEALGRDIVDGRIEGVVLKDRESPYRDGSRAGWWKVKDRGWYEREAWRFDRRS